jgi:uncharacterized membrane protein
MSATDAFLLVVRWLHLAAAAVWIGGSIFYLFVLRPAARSDPDYSGATAKTVASRFRTAVDLSIVVLVATGAIIAFNRLSGGTVGVSYVTVLAVKVALSAWMFAAVQMERRTAAVMKAYRTGDSESTGEISPMARARATAGAALSGYGGITVIGIVVFLLSDALAVLFEIALRAD